MNIPLNGRIAIIDDQIKHAIPLMNELSKRQLPFTYFTGEEEFLPDTNNNFNDIRILFLDINLIDDREHGHKELKSKLIPVLRRVISKENYPYVIIYWTRHENHKNLIESDIFLNDLSDRAPIAYMSAVKSDYFNHDGTNTDDFDKNISNLFEKINSLISSSLAYNYLLQWENFVHYSADKTLHDIFSSYHSISDWKNNANYILNKLGSAYLGKNFKISDSKDKIKSSLMSLNVILNDTLENKVNLGDIISAKELTVVSGTNNIDSIHSINTKLLISNEIEPIYYPGTIIEDLDSKKDKKYKHLLLDSLKQLSKKKSDKDKEIQQSWKKVWLNVTPYCDMAHNKIANHRLIRGLIVKDEYKSLFFNNEAIYTTPSFQIDSISYILVLNFKHLFTLDSIKKSKLRKPLFRLRQQMIAEVQSKLSRHINRQGILFIT